MLINIYFLITNLFLFTLIQSRRRYKSSTGRTAAGIGKMTGKFGQGVATLIKDIKQGNFGQKQQAQNNIQKSQFQYTNYDKTKYHQSIGNDTAFQIISITFMIIIVLGILYYIVKIYPIHQQKRKYQQMKKRNKDKQRNSKYDTIKFITQNGIHPAKAFGNLQKIKYK